MENRVLGKGKDRRRQIILTAVVGLVVNLCLSALKLYVGTSANSLSILTDGINNAADTFSFFIVILSFQLMRKSPSEETPFGYGRMEYIAGFVMSALVVIVGLYFAWSALERLLYPYLLTFTWLNFSFIAITVPVKIVLAFYFRHQNKTLHSDVLKTSFMDSMMDAGITLMTLIGFSLARYAKLRLDALLGLAISVIILVNGIKLLIGNIKNLLGKRMDEKLKEGVLAYLAEVSEICEVKEMAAHDYGADTLELVIEVVFTNGCDSDTILKVSQRVKAELANRYHIKSKICIAEEGE